MRRSFVLLRTSPAFNYYVMGPRKFGPFAFPTSDDRTAEKEFKAWLEGSLDTQMAYGARPEGQYTLWRQPITSDTHVADFDSHADMLHDMMEDELVAAELLPVVYNIRPMVDYSEFRFIGHVKNWHAALAPGSAAGVEDIFLVSSYRADRIMLFGVYGEPTEENPRPWWTSWLNTTMPTYAPNGTSLLRELGSLVNVDLESYGHRLH